MPSAWIAHVKSVYAKIKPKGGSYRDAMVQAKKTYKKGASKEDASPKKKKRRVKKKKSKKLSPDEEQ